MRIERVDDTTVKLFITYSDIEARGFSREDLWSNRKRGEEFFWSMMDEINEEEMNSEDYFKKSIAYEKNDLTHEAIKIMQTLLSKDPDFIQGYFYLQSLFENEKNYPDAIETGKEGLRLSQFYKELMVSTGSLEIEHGDANEGVELLKQALEVDNAYHEPLLILSDLYRNEE
ncbi:adaptor protein MecA, partial [Brevibacillus laterosporus]|uniref:adaptor protein MecA n=1 Tax=Brevibacillus laterosporus TaxID=1465 RepID=UPI0022A6A7B5